METIMVKHLKWVAITLNVLLAPHLFAKTGVLPAQVTISVGNEVSHSFMTPQKNDLSLVPVPSVVPIFTIPSVGSGRTSKQNIKFGTPESHNFTLLGYPGSVVGLAYGKEEIILTNGKGELIVFKPVPLLQTCMIGVNCKKIPFNGSLQLNGIKAGSVFTGNLIITQDYH